MTAIYLDWLDSYPLVSVEDPLAEEDWVGWQAFTAAAGDRVQVVDDDIFVTNPERIRRGIAEKSAQPPKGPQCRFDSDWGHRIGMSRLLGKRPCICIWLCMCTAKDNTYRTRARNGAGRPEGSRPASALFAALMP
jgi:hypothetical protein